MINQKGEGDVQVLQGQGDHSWAYECRVVLYTRILEFWLDWG